MKSKKNQRLLALILSMVLMLSASISAMAEGDVQTEASGTEVTQNQAEEQSLEEETVPETEVTTEEAGIDTQSAEISEEPVQETTEQETAVTSGEATEPVQEATGESTETEVPTTEETTGEETQSVEGQPEETTTAEEQPAETSEETLPEEEVVSEAAELKQEFTDENGNVTQTITAYVPEGAFQATADQISMEVTLLNTDDTDYIKGMMEELIPENNYLDGYVLYQIDFKVNGEIAKPAKAITITMTGNELAVEDTQKAHVFYYDSEDPEVEGDKDQLVEVIQKDQLIKSLEESGQSTENIEDYDYSEIAVNEGNADTITVKGWESTIYGCYVEKESVQEATYEDDTVKVTVSADEKGIIPNKTILQVVPISNNGDTKDQYKEVEKKLQEKAEKDEYEIAGFLAYDISFVDKDGNEVEPNGEVRVSIEYKEATLPEGMTEEEAKKAEVSMIHLEEDENGEVKEVVDMAEKDQVEAIATTESQQVEKVAVKTESFSKFTITWKYYGYYYDQSFDITVHYVNAQGVEIPEDKVEDFPKEGIDLGTNENEIDLQSYVKNIDGYTFSQQIKLDAVSGDDSKEARYLTKTYWNGTYYIRYKNSENDRGTTWLSSGRNDITEGDVYLIYNENAQSTSGIKIIDNIAEKGQLGTELSDDLRNQISDLVDSGETISYGWLKKEKGTEFAEVELIKSGTDYNILEDGKSLDIIIDGADKEKETVYKAVVYKGDGEDKEILAESEAFEIPYYRELMNGGFETPISHGQSSYPGNGGPSTANSAQWSNENYEMQGGVWQTTGVGDKNGKNGQDIEVLNDKVSEVSTGFMSQGPKEDAEKPEAGQNDNCHQFAEINCEAAGALYQDVLTSQTTSLNYWLYHCARSRDSDDDEYGSDKWGYKDRYDTMYLVIMPTETAEGYTEHEDLINYLNDKLNGIDTIPVEAKKNTASQEEARIIYNQDGLLIARITSNEKDWHYISSDSITSNFGISKTYTPTSSLTRFFFISGATAAGNVRENGKNIGDTIGNLVDGIGFGQQLPPAEQGQVRVQIQKTISGLTKEQTESLISKLRFTIQAYDANTEERVLYAPLDNKIVNASDMEVSYTSEEDGTVTAHLSSSYLTDQIDYQERYLYKVTELNLNMENMEVSTSCDIIVTGGEECDDGAVLGEQDSAVFDFTNEYTSSYRTEDVNFFLNLSSKILDTDGNITSQDKGDFTTSVSGSYTDDESASGIGIALNADLKVKLPSSHETPTSTTGVIAGNSDTNAKAVDEMIRDLEDGVEGNQEGYTDKTYQIIDGDNNGAFPTDEEIFKYIRDYWNYKYSYTDSNGTHTSDVHKGKNITVNGIAIDPEKLTTDNFVIRWYTFKYEPSDQWHVDGILVPRSGVLNITKTFESKEIVELLDDNFSINVTGNFLSSEADGTATVSNKLDSESVKMVENEDGSVTYTWSLAIFGDSYEVEEVNYGLNSDDWSYSKTDYVYTPIEGNKTEGTATRVTVETERQWDDEGKKSQTLDFTNYYTANAKLDLKKISANSETPISGAKFKLSKLNSGNWEVIQPNIDINNEENTPYELKGLVPGIIYKLEEIEAPDAYALLGEPIYFKVEGNTVQLCDEDGEAFDSAEIPNMWYLSKDGLVLTIKNNPAYDLPSAGGPGIFLYMIGGTLLLMAGSLMIYINRRRGVLKK